MAGLGRAGGYQSNTQAQSATTGTGMRGVVFDPVGGRSKFGQAGGIKLPSLPGMGGTSTGSGVGSASSLVLDPKTGKYVQGSTGGGPGGIFGPGGLQNVAQKDPTITATQQKLDARFQQLKGKEGQMDPFLQESIGNLRDRMSADTTQRATDVAGSRIRDQQAGAESQLAARRARTGSAGGGYGQLSEAAQRAQAKATADIQLGRERDLDQLTLQGHGILAAPSGLETARTGLTNQAMGTMAGFAPEGAKLGLAQQGLGLEQWKTGADIGYKNALLQQQGQQNQVDLYLKMLAASGY